MSGGLPFPEAVSQMRYSLGMSQEDFADYLGMTQWRLSEIERGAANPRLETMRRIAQAFDLEVGFVKTAPDPATSRPATSV